MSTRAPRPGFTLIELLVVIAVIALLISIVLPSLAGSRETSRRVKCLTNLRGIGGGVQVYLNDFKGIFPYVRPLHGGGDPNDPSLLDLLADYVDAPVPREGPDGYYIVTDPFRCPSDLASDDEGKAFEPVWRTDGTSYEYLPGAFMLFAELLGVTEPAKAVTRAYENDRNWPFLSDQGAWHKLRKIGTPKNALYFPDYRGDWFVEPTAAESARFFDDLKKFGGLN